MLFWSHNWFFLVVDPKEKEVMVLAQENNVEFPTFYLQIQEILSSFFCTIIIMNNKKENGKPLMNFSSPITISRKDII